MLQTWTATLAEAAVYQFPKQLRHLFSILLKTCDVGNPLHLWNKYKDYFAQDYKHQAQLANPQFDVLYTDEIYNKALIDIEDIIASMGGPHLVSFGLPQTDRTGVNNLATEVIRETSYDINYLSDYVNDNEQKLLPDQLSAYSTILNSISEQKGGIYFLDAPGATGKTFVTKLLLATVRKQNKIAVAVAFSGIAATLLPGSRTAHSAFKLPLDLATVDDPVCQITKNSGMGEVSRKCHLIIWDECTMAHKKALEALNKSLQDLRNHKVLMGVGAPIILLRNLSQPQLCNGTRLIIKALHPHIIEAEIQTGCGKGEDTFIPRIPLITSDLPIQFKRLQFPVKLSFAMSINKSQGQTLQVVGLQLQEDCFAHGQLYVGCSREGALHKLFVYSPFGKTTNVVYKEVLK